MKIPPWEVGRQYNRRQAGTLERTVFLFHHDLAPASREKAGTEGFG